MEERVQMIVDLTFGRFYIEEEPNRPFMLNSLKADLQALVEHLPEDVGMEEVRYKLYVLEAIREGLDDLDHGRTHTQAEIETEVRTWPSE